MELNVSCMRCLFDRQEERTRKQGSPKDRNRYMREVARIIAEEGENECAPVLLERCNQVYQTIFGIPTDYESVKQYYNDLMIELLPDFRKQIALAEDPLYMAMTLAQAGNYIDFGASSSVDQETLLSILQNAFQDELDNVRYQAFLKDLALASNLVFLVDNCGEVVLDKLVIEACKKRFPELAVTVIVRGQNVVNDVTREDAEQVGLTEVARIIDNGCGVAGTPLAYISNEARVCLENADVILSKGQGNFETLHGCGLNIYYSFLCKCDLFRERFGAMKNQGVFIREGDWKEE